MLKKISIVLALCFSTVSLYASPCTTGYGPESVQDNSCGSGKYCSFSNKKCKDKKGEGKDCNRDAQCKHGCMQSKKCKGN